MRIICLLVMLPLASWAAVAADLPPGDCRRPAARTDLSACDLSRARLAGQDLRGARFAGAKLENADLRKARLEEADFRSANAKWANFSGARMKGADLRNADLFHAIFDDADVSDARFGGAYLFGANLINTRALRADFAGAHLKDILMEGIDLSGGSMRGCYAFRGVLSGAKLVGTDLSGADLTGAAAENADFTGARLVGTKLLGATLRFAVFKEADMAGADLANADVWNANFTQARNRPDSVQEALIEPFVVRDPFPEDFTREIQRVKVRVEQERIPPGEDPQFHLKLGKGALTDVEFAVQLLQLRHCGARPEIRTPATIDGLHRLVAADLLAEADGAVLEEAYRFCERARNARYLILGQPGDDLPGGADDVRIGRLLGYVHQPRAELRDEFRRVTRRARRVVERVFYGRD